MEDVDVGDEEEDELQAKAVQADSVVRQGESDEEAARKAAEQQAMRLAALAVLDEGWDDDVGKVWHGSKGLKRIAMHVPCSLS